MQACQVVSAKQQVDATTFRNRMDVSSRNCNAKSRLPNQGVKLQKKYQLDEAVFYWFFRRLKTAIPEKFVRIQWVKRFVTAYIKMKTAVKNRRTRICRYIGLLRQNARHGNTVKLRQ
jgi:hypothetical protein